MDSRANPTNIVTMKSAQTFPVDAWRVLGEDVELSQERFFLLSHEVQLTRVHDGATQLLTAVHAQEGVQLLNVSQWVLSC